MKFALAGRVSLKVVAGMGLSLQLQKFSYPDTLKKSSVPKGGKRKVKRYLDSLESVRVFRKENPVALKEQLPYKREPGLKVV